MGTEEPEGEPATPGHSPPWASTAHWSRLTAPSAPAGVVVAVSGGPDSVALLRALTAGPLPGPLVVAHLNHCLRGAEADADADFVRDLAAAIGCRFATHSVDVARLASQAGDNRESTARRVRYGWLAEVAQAAGCARVATGHTADDQAETVLHRLLRGTGLAGLRGIAACRPLAAGVELVRPLLGVTRREVLAYLAQLGQPYRHDATNDDRRLMRNRIRHELLPLLAEGYSPGVASLLTGLAGQAAEAFAEVESAAGRLLAAAERPRAGAMLVFDRMALLTGSRYLRTEALRLAWAREGWPLGGMNRAAWGRVAAVVEGDLGAVDLPGRVRVRRRGRVVHVGPADG